MVPTFALVAGWGLFRRFEKAYRSDRGDSPSARRKALLRALKRLLLYNL